MGTRATARGERQRRALAEREHKLARVAERQHGVITRRQLIAGGLSPRTISRRLEAGRLHRLHGGVYAYGRERVTRRGEWIAAVLACGKGAVLSHASAAALWGLMRDRPGRVDVIAITGRERPGISVHQAGLGDDDRAEVAGIPVTTVARTLFDIAETVDEHQLERAFEEADRLHLLRLAELDAVCARGYGRRALRPIRRLIDEARYTETTRSPLEDRVIALCREYHLPAPVTNVTVLGREVDVLWPRERLVVEADGYAHHGHRAAFERDRARDAEMQVAGYRVIRITHRRLEREPARVAGEIRALLNASSSE
jgi:very-short-patch-repair endonuclease/predicted transcriptional regulator of viral defense system